LYCVYVAQQEWLIDSSIDEVLALEKRPEVKNLPDAEGRKGKNGKPGEILYALIRHHCKEDKVNNMQCAEIRR
jgi:hypothetical protein